MRRWSSRVTGGGGRGEGASREEQGENSGRYGTRGRGHTHRLAWWKPALWRSWRAGDTLPAWQTAPGAFAGRVSDAPTAGKAVGVSQVRGSVPQGRCAVLHVITPLGLDAALSGSAGKPLNMPFTRLMQAHTHPPLAPHSARPPIPSSKRSTRPTTPPPASLTPHSHLNSSPYRPARGGHGASLVGAHRQRGAGPGATGGWCAHDPARPLPRVRLVPHRHCLGPCRHGASLICCRAPQLCVDCIGASTSALCAVQLL